MTNYATRWSGATPMNLDVTMRSTTPAEAGLANAGLGFERPVPEGVIGGGTSMALAIAGGLV